MNDLIQSFVLGIVEGVTEFLPVSSTGHMRLVEAFTTPIVNESFAKNFDIFIQIGAIAAVLVYFREKVLYLMGLGKHYPVSASVLTDAPPTPGATPTDPLPYAAVATPPNRVRVLLLLAIATAPLSVGYLAAKKSEKFIAAHPGIEPKMIAAALGIGGVLMILIELLRPKARIQSMEQISPTQALVIGICQIFAAVFPGTSRSAATIMPALCLGVARPVAAEFSFFLAIPAMFAAAGIKLVKFLKSPDATPHQFMLLAIGTLVSFIVAYFVIAGFMSFIRKYSFTPFGVYRIILAIAVFSLVHD